MTSPTAKLTPHFTVAEALVRSGVTTLPPNVLPNVLKLASILESIRQLVGNRPIVPTSWYRPADKNRAVGGVATSGHQSGFAADFVVEGMTPAEVVRIIAPYVATLGIDQLIQYDTHVHVSADPRSRAQLLLAHRNGSDTTYTPWTPHEAAARSSVMATVAPATEPGAPRRYSPAWWIVLVGLALEAARHLLAKGS